VAAAVALREAGRFASETEAQQKTARAIKAAAEQLGNTPAVCRACYVHPAVVEAYLEGRLSWAFGHRLQRTANGLEPDEAAVLSLLRNDSAGRCGKSPGWSHRRE